jgi:hypothetical protein
LGRIKELLLFLKNKIVADAETRYQSGCKFAHGEKRDYVVAIRWYNKAPEQGYIPAEYELGEIYMFVYDFIDALAVEK